MNKEPESKFKDFLHAKKEQAEQVPVKLSEPPATETVRTRERLSGKRGNADFEQVTAYIRKSTHRAVKIALLQEGKKRQFSELVEHLLTKWLEGN